MSKADKDGRQKRQGSDWPKAAIYVSAPRQGTIERWRREASRFAKLNSYRVVSVQSDVTNDGCGKPGLGALLAQASKGLFETVIIPSLPRLSKSISEAVTALRELRKAGCGWRFVLPGQSMLDWDASNGKTADDLLEVISALDKADRWCKSEDTRESMASLKASGVWVARHPTRCECPIHRKPKKPEFGSPFFAGRADGS